MKRLSKLDGFLFEEMLGRGSFTEVWKVSKDGKYFAAKLVDSAVEYSKKAIQMGEIMIDKKFNSLYLMKYFKKITHDKLRIFVMEYCSQGNLYGLTEKVDMKKGIILSEARLMKVFIQGLLGLEVLHRNKILHGEIKPDHLCLDDKGDVKIGGFGCMTVLEPPLYQTEIFAGTTAYMAPEIFLGKPYTFSADMWSLGVLLYKLTTNNLPFNSNNSNNTFEIVRVVVEEKYAPIPEGECSPGISTLIDCLLRKNPFDRPTALALLRNPYVERFAEILHLKEHYPQGKVLDDGNDGDIIGNYQLNEKIGRGGSGTVYLAKDCRDHRRVVAVKFVEVTGSDAVQKRSLDAEVQVGLHLGSTCPFLVTYESVFVTPSEIKKKYGPGFFLVMEYCPGGDLATAITERRKAPIPQRVYYTDTELLHFVVQVGSAVDMLHRAGIVHRDLKPENIFLTADGGYKVGDFSISRAIDSQRKTTVGSSTTVYAAPEFLNGDLEYAREKDIYSLGCILLELIDLGHPFANESGYVQQGRIFTGRANAARVGLTATAKALRDFALLMISTDPSKRPSISALFTVPAVVLFLRSAYENGLQRGNSGNGIGICGGGNGGGGSGSNL